MEYVRTVARFKDPGVEQQMREVVQKANTFFGTLDNHAGRRDNPHQVTAKQVGAVTSTDVDNKLELHTNRKDNPHQVTATQIGAETPAGAQAKADQVQAKLTAHQNELLPYAFKKNATTGTLEIFYQLTKIGELDSLGNLKLKGIITPEASI